MDYQDYEITFEDINRKPYIRPVNDLKTMLNVLDSELERPVEKLRGYQTAFTEQLDDPIVSELCIAQYGRDLIRTHVEIQHCKDRMINVYRDCINRMLAILDPLFSQLEEEEETVSDVAPVPMKLSELKKRAKKEALSSDISVSDLFVKQVKRKDEEESEEEELPEESEEEEDAKEEE